MPKFSQNKKEEIKKKKDGIFIQSSLRDAILVDIHTKNIAPRPKWQYLLLHILLWVSGIGTILLGSFAFSFVLLEFSLPARVYLSWVEMKEETGMMEILPYLWSVGMILALTAGYFIFSRTDRSYRLHAGMIAGALVFGSLVGGTVLYATHTVHWGDRQLQNIEPRYRELRQGFIRMMPRPEEGFLPLRVTEIQENIILGNSPDGLRWSVYVNCDNDDCEVRKTKIRVGKPSVFEGEISSLGNFEATDVLPGPGFRPKNKRPFIRPNELDNMPLKKGE